jgi:Family of unknown function (DUF5694)
MKIFAIILFSVISTFSQTLRPEPPNPKIKVILLGTFHYGATSDRNSTSFPDLFSAKRQAELDIIAQKLVAAGVDKFMLERASEKQTGLSANFDLYKNAKMVNSAMFRNEITQIAYRTAKINNAKLVATDYPQELPYGKIEQYEKKHKNDTVNVYPFFEIKYPFTTKLKKLKEATLSEYYIQMNGHYYRQSIMYDYLHYALGYGVGNDFVGQSLTLSWYDRNLKIFTNILRNIDPKTDKTIVVLYGAAHTTAIRHFFEDHPYFEIVELDEVLK